MIDALRRLARPQTFSSRQLLFRRGQRPESLFWVENGELCLVRIGADGREIILQRTHTGYFAEASFDAAEYHCDGIAGAAGAQVLALPLVNLRQLLTTDSALALSLLVDFSHEIRRLRVRCERLSMLGAANRIRHYLLLEGTEGEVSVGTLKSLAAELGLAHETLYRTLHRLQRQNQIVVCDDPAGKRLRWIGA